MNGVPPDLASRVDSFLNSVRVGVDLGEAAGGIAVVRNREILHAETYVDFHDATLEQRRILRRGRRTRHAKKMRLARLRSWVLRQKLPNGERLPDPYDVLADKRFWPKPGTYETKGADPCGGPGWIEVAQKDGLDARGFVRAITLIFKKRGYRYDDKDFEDLPDARLHDFLESCCILREAGTMAEQLRAEVERRARPKLTAAYENSLNRPPEPRKAVPRQIKENAVRVIVQRFGEKHRMEPMVIERWCKELVGLLNRVLRPARFDNRLRSGCSWCGKKTPRLKKPEVRFKAFRAAVGNLRVPKWTGAREFRSLSNEERKPLLDWWEKRASGSDFPKGPKVPVTERAPSEDNISKYLDSIESPRRWMKNSKGQWNLDHPMLPQLNDLLNRTPRRGRAKLCMQHLDLAAGGGSMMDAGLAWQQMRGRHAPNPRREQHDQRVLRRLEEILFIRGKKGQVAWRHGPVALLTLEIPDPQTERVGKGKQTERKTLSIRERLHGESGGTCMYCGKEIPVEATEMDHIVPRARGGPDLQLNRVAACHTCNHPDTGKGNRLPSEWKKEEEWLRFEERVRRINMPDFKRMLLLLPAGANYPDDPTPLARVAARSGAFAAEIAELFKTYGVEPPSPAYILGKPHLQVVSGRWTRDLRMSWLFHDREARQENFPRKDRTDLFNHAQDAALLAATPPHTWRPRILCETAVRPCVKKDEKGALVVLENGSFEHELRPRPGVALLALAPDWAGFLRRRAVPIVRELGKLKATWRRQLMDLSLFQQPANVDTPKLWVHKPLPQPTTTGQRRYTAKSQKGGLVVRVPHHDGTSGVRKVQVKPIQSEAAILWSVVRGSRESLCLSRVRPRAIRELVQDMIDPPLPKRAKKIGRIERGEVIRLDGVFYRVKELSRDNVIVIPENALPDALADRQGIPREQRAASPERTLGKRELLAYFRSRPDPAT
ncbi:MAG: HNH endonuclease [Nitrospirae bacterium]|nr:HNH endonuclease [Nitrospirota bacterium]